MNGKGTPDWEASWWVVFVIDTIPCSCFSSGISGHLRPRGKARECRPVGSEPPQHRLVFQSEGSDCWAVRHLVGSSYRRSCCDSLFEFLPVLFAVVLALELSQIKRCDPTRLILCQSMPVVESFFVTGFETSFSPALVVLDEPVRDPRWPDFDFRVRRGILDAELDVGADNIVLLIQGITTGENLIPWGKVQVAGQFWASCSLLTSRKVWCLMLGGCSNFELTMWWSESRMSLEHSSFRFSLVQVDVFSSWKLNDVLHDDEYLQLWH